MDIIKVSKNKRFLTVKDDKPFFWLGDTCWSILHCLSKEDMDFYLETRATQGFNVIQVVAITEHDGLKGNYYGDAPLLKNAEGQYDPSMPDDSNKEYGYWNHLDYLINTAEKYNIYVALLPTWGDKFNVQWGEGPEIFTPENAYIYGKWLGQKYKEKNNIIWVLGGDRPLDEEKNHYEIINQMANGLKEGDEGRHLCTFHPTGGKKSSEYVHDRDWLDFNMVQTGHRWQCHQQCYDVMLGDYNLTPIKPVLDAEPCYEDHPIDFREINGYYDQANVRNAAYWNVFSGVCGHTYGHHSIWSFITEVDDYFIMDWRTAMIRPGAEQMKYLKKLINRYPTYDCAPVADIIIKDNKRGVNFVSATMNNKFLLAYSPNGIKFTILVDKLNSKIVTALWYCPRTGGTQNASFNEGDEITFYPPASGRGNDWILILE